MPGGTCRVSCPRLLNHSRFPDGRAHGFAAPLRVALGLRPKCPQGTRFPSRLSGARNAGAQRDRGRPHAWRERWARGRACRGGSGRTRRGFCRAVRRSVARRRPLRGAARRVSCPRLLNHSRFPDGRAHGFAAPLRVALGLRPKCPGCSIIRASLTVALMVSLPRFGSLCASRKCPPGTRFPSRHRARASLRAFQALETLAPPPFAAKTAHATASVGWVWDPPASERRPREYRAQHGPRPQGAGHAQQHNTAHSMDRALKARDMRSNFFLENG